jgi:hypothetical protein
VSEREKSDLLHAGDLWMAERFAIADVQDGGKRLPSARIRLSWDTGSGAYCRYTQPTAVVRKRCFCCSFRGPWGPGSESLPLRHIKTASRKPRKIRTSCAPGFAGVAPGCSAEGGPNLSRNSCEGKPIWFAAGEPTTSGRAVFTRVSGRATRRRQLSLREQRAMIAQGGSGLRSCRF